MILFDAHVHIYDVFHLDTLIISAFENFDAAIRSLRQDMKNCSCFLLLAESNGPHYFSELREKAQREGRGFSGSWSLAMTQENRSLQVFHPDFPDLSLFIVAGRQLVTKERLELLALFTDGEFAAGMDMQKAVDTVVSNGGLPVCAWGAGKWLGKRGLFLKDFLQSSAGSAVFLGDSGGRPTPWRPSRLLYLPSHRRRVVSGTDPLALAGEEKRVGSFGGYLEGICEQGRPAQYLQERMLKKDVNIRSFGRSLNMISFVRNQALLRMQR